MQTDKKIDQSNDIRWTMGAEIDYFIFTSNYIRTRGCDDYIFKGTEGFLQRAGVLTFQKTTTQLQIWFDDVLEVTWVYVGDTCSMKELMAGLRFHGHLSSNYDKVSAHYRYEVELGNFTTCNNNSKYIKSCCARKTLYSRYIYFNARLILMKLKYDAFHRYSTVYGSRPSLDPDHYGSNIPGRCRDSANSVMCGGVPTEMQQQYHLY